MYAIILTMDIIFFDTQTTGIEESDRLCQLAVKERGVAEPLLNARYKPPVPISFAAMGVRPRLPAVVVLSKKDA
jgi:hypothetical protein